MSGLAWSLPLFRLSGIPVTLHWSFLLVLALILITSPGDVFVLIGLFAIVLAHEFGHCWAAQYCNIPVSGVTLTCIGGVAMLDANARSYSAKNELFYTVCGPLVNVLLIPVLYLFWDYPIMKQLAVMNFIMLIFNLIPAFPLDGGRIARALLVMFLRSLSNPVMPNVNYEATKYAVYASTVICIGMGGLGIYWWSLNLLLLAFFIFIGGRAELEHAKQVDAYQGDGRVDAVRRVNSVQEQLNDIDRRYHGHDS